MIVHEETQQAVNQEQPAPVCCHYWIIETAHGPISRGECQICHEVRDFKNSVFDLERESQDSRSQTGPEVEPNGQQAVAPPTSGESSQDPVDDELEPDEFEPEGAEIAELEAEEPEFVGVSED